MSIESVMLSNHLILCHPLLLLPSIFPSISISESALHIKWPKYWSCSFSISPSSEYSGLISFRIYWFDFSAVQDTLKSLSHDIGHSVFELHEPLRHDKPVIHEAEIQILPLVNVQCRYSLLES